MRGRGRLEKLLFARLTKTRPVGCIRFGSAYGGWAVPEGVLGPASVVYSGGVGEDATFDEAVMRAYGCHVYAFDPTPRSIAYVRGVSDERFHFMPIGLWDADTTKHFVAPTDPDAVSHAIGDADDGRGGFTAACRSIVSLMSELGHLRLDLLKLDIEGAEYAVVPSLFRADVEPRVLCVELHGGLRRALQLSRGIEARGYDLVGVDGWDVTFLRRPARLADGTG
jgi:FkbM family methyltransferase